MHIHPRDVLQEHEYRRRELVRNAADARYELDSLTLRLGVVLYRLGKQLSAMGCR